MLAQIWHFGRNASDVRPQAVRRHSRCVSTCVDAVIEDTGQYQILCGPEGQGQRANIEGVQGFVAVVAQPKLCKLMYSKKLQIYNLNYKIL